MASVSTQMASNPPQPLGSSNTPPQQLQQQQSQNVNNITIDDFITQLSRIENFPILPEAIESLDTLFVYLNNLINSPTELKYHTISAVNIHFHERLGHLPFAEPLLSSIGYKKSNQPIPHYRFNIDLLGDQSTTTATLAVLQEALRLVENLRNQLNIKYKELPHIPATTVSLTSVTAAGRFADRGRRVTMEDQEALIDQFYPKLAEDLARLYAEYLLIHQPVSTTNSVNEILPSSREKLTQELMQLMPNYSNLAFFAVYDGHGGTETAEFAVKFLHQSIRQEIIQFISQKLHLELTSQPQIKQQQQFLHITDQFLTQLPTIDQIQELPTDCVNSTDFSGKSAFLYYEDFISQYLNNALSTPPSSPIVVESSLSNGFEHPEIPIKTPLMSSLLTEKATEFGGVISRFTSPLSSPMTDATSPIPQPLTTSTLAANFAELAPTRMLTRALFQAHVRTDNQLRRCLALHSGCTTVTSIVGNFGGQRFIITGNCGDSRAILTSQSTQCCHFAMASREEKPHIFLRHLDPSTNSPLHSNLHSNDPTNDPYFAKLPVKFDAVKGLPTHLVQFGDTTIQQNHRVVAQRLSLDHKPSIPNETARIASLGGFVSNNGRTMGVLAVSRALGDHGLKNTRHYVSSRPHIDLTLLADPEDNNSIQNPFLLLACDGVWDVVKDQDAVLFITGVVGAAVQQWVRSNNIQICATDSQQEGESNFIGYQFTEQFQTISMDEQDKNKKNNICATCVQRFLPKTMLNCAMSLASQRLVELALLNGSTDNVTAMTIRL